MELWIRTQNSKALMKCTMLNLDNDETGIFVYNNDNYMIMAGKYKNKERALEVLDEIQSKLKQQYIVRPNGLTSIEDKYKEAARLDYCYNGDFIMENEMFKIEPISSGIVIYEMPKE